MTLLSLKNCTFIYIYIYIIHYFFPVIPLIALIKLKCIYYLRYIFLKIDQVYINYSCIIFFLITQ